MLPMDKFHLCLFLLHTARLLLKAMVECPVILAVLPVPGPQVVALLLLKVPPSMELLLVLLVHLVLSLPLALPPPAPLPMEHLVLNSSHHTSRTLNNPATLARFRHHLHLRLFPFLNPRGCLPPLSQMPLPWNRNKCSAKFCT